VTGPLDKPSEDATWREIVANYGDRPALEVDAETQRAQPQAAEPEHPELADIGSQDDRFVPPPPPPLPRVPKDRLAAWLGVFVSPLLLLFATVLRIELPTLASWLLIGAFLGGFGYLVAQMPRGPRDPYDDGAVL
jgi:hypothetical protein